MTRLLDAIEFAIDKHSGQLRKDKKTPYITHVLSVGLIVSRITQNENAIIAGLLHDSIEDTTTSREELKDRFGDEVLKIVIDMTEEDKSLDWSTRKELATKKIRIMDHNSAVVKAADILHNVYTLKTNIEKNGLEHLNVFNGKPADNIAVQRRNIEELKKYHPSIPILNEIEECVIYLENQWDSHTRVPGT